MKLAIIARQMYCTRVLEMIQGYEYEHTDTQHFNNFDLAVFTVKAKEEDIIFLEKLVRSEFYSGDVISLRYITGKYPMLLNPQ